MEVELHPIDGETVTPEDAETVVIETAKRRGRPPGAKNKTKPKPEVVEEQPVEESSEPEPEPEPKPTLPIPKRKKRVVVESESEEELPKPVRRKKPVQPPPDSPRTHRAKLRQDYHNQRVQGYTNLLSEMLSH